LQQKDLAAKTLKTVGWNSKTYDSDGYYDGLSHQSQLLYIYAKHFPTLLEKLPATVLDSMAQRINNREYSSLSAAYLLLALTQYGEVATTQTQTPLKLSAITLNDALQALASAPSLIQKVDVPTNSKGVQVNQDTQLPLFYSLTESGFDKQSATLPEVKQGLEIQREYLDLAGNALEKVKVGDEFLVRLRLRAVDKDYISQVAVVDLLPGGVEPVINRSPVPANTQARPGSSDEEVEGDEGSMEGEGEYAEGEGNGESENVDDVDATETPAEAFVAGFSGEPGQSTWTAEFADLRDDRLVIYGSLTKDMVTFTYRVRATNTGLYQTPAAYAEAMYQQNLFARSKASKFSVVKP